MVLENLGQSLRDVLKKIVNASNIDEKLVKEITKDIQRALLQADVNVKLVLEFTKEVERRALTEKPPAGKSSREHVINIIYDELVKILGEHEDAPAPEADHHDGRPVRPRKDHHHRKTGPLLSQEGHEGRAIAGDVYRPAAYDQLKQIADKVGIHFFGIPAETNAAKIVAEGHEGIGQPDIVIIDTSGRHALEADLIQEIKDMADVAKPTERILVLDASVGQQAGPQAQAFHDAVGVTCVILTKMDGTAKGGGALCAVARTKAPIVFIGVGEHLEDLDPFIPSRFISRHAGHGRHAVAARDAKENISEEEAEEVTKKIMSGKFTLRRCTSRWRCSPTWAP